MEIDTDRIDEVDPRHAPPGPHDRCWAWKGFDWDVMGRLHEGFISDRVGKAGPVAGGDQPFRIARTKARAMARPA